MKDHHNTGSFPAPGNYTTGSYSRPGGAKKKGSSRGKSYLFLFFALFFAVLVGWLVLNTLETASAGQKPISTVPVVIAAQDIPLGTTLNANHLRVIAWPLENAPTTRFANIEDLIGRVAKVDLFTNEMIHDARLAPVEAGNGLGALIPSGMRAQAIRVNDESGVAGFVHPGDFVDIVMIFRTDEGAEAKTSLQNIKVIAIGDQYQSSDESRGKAMKVPVVTVLVTPSQAELLSMAITNGQLVLTLRNGYDSEQVASVGFNPQKSALDIKQPIANIQDSDEEDKPKKDLKKEPKVEPKKDPKKEPVIETPIVEPPKEPALPTVEKVQTIKGNKIKP
jgi:pilus assembly protein CpaB